MKETDIPLFLIRHPVRQRNGIEEIYLRVFEKTFIGQKCYWTQLNSIIMAWKFLIVSVLIVVATADNDCRQERGTECMEMYMNTLLGDLAEEEICGAMANAVACLRSFVDECLSEQSDSDLAKGLSQLDRFLKENCAVQGEADAYNTCVHEHRDYLFHCIALSSEETTVTAEGGENASEDELRCREYERLGQCLVDRTVEKCGSKAGKRAREDLKKLDLPWINRCSQSELFTFVESELLKRRRK